ncbi:MAG: SRPBCC family protein [Oscillochloris sp.]|nr:SRPBCC family protein [Oscillochloris sp.]
MEVDTFLQEEFVLVAADMDRVERVMTDHELMQRWMSPAVRFEPLEGWHFEPGAPWRLHLTGLGRLLEARYVVHERRPGLVLWAFDGFWEGFDAWHWLPHGEGSQTLIQNRIEYRLRVPGLSAIWPATVGPLMGWDARVQMQRLKAVCES